MDRTLIGEKRCPLEKQHREFAYGVFKQYTQWLKDKGLWDDCDRVSHSLNYIGQNKLHFTKNMYSKIYVDEVQDYTQSEIAIFYILCNTKGGLFLAGDTAQSVVEGVTFRFDEVRSVAHLMDPSDIPSKPLLVTKNFRSHSGVLDVAATVLKLLFKAFPDGTNKLAPDEGVFVGPRPGLFSKLGDSDLRKLLQDNQDIVVLTLDKHVESTKELTGHGLVFGIREAKGLEFNNVLLLNCFHGLTEDDRKVWRSLLNSKDNLRLDSGFQEVESQLKLLYTGITRCCNRLFIAESEIPGNKQQPGAKFMRWLTKVTEERKTPLAVEMDPTKEIKKTPDEYRSQGVEMAVHAEQAETVEQTVKWLNSALWCFERGGQPEFEVKKAELHKKGASHRLHLSQISAEQHRESTSPTSRSKSPSTSESEDVNVEGLEHTTVEIVLACLMGDLVFEAMEVCRAFKTSSLRLLHKHVKPIFDAEVLAKLESLHRYLEDRIKSEDEDTHGNDDDDDDDDDDDVDDAVE